MQAAFMLRYFRTATCFRQDWRRATPPAVTLMLSLLSACATVPATRSPPVEPVPPPPPAASPAAIVSLPPGPFATEIAAFGAVDATRPQNTCSVLFVGSSSIRLWTSLQADMAPVPTLNRGFGGAQISDLNLYFDNVVSVYKPKAIYFYAGENDLASGKTPGQVTADFETFLALKTARLGAVPVTFISLKPSRLRFAQMELQTQVNKAIVALAADRTDLSYVDVASAMMDEGIPKDIYVADGLHMSPQGYAIWTSILKPKVEASAALPCPIEQATR